MFEDIIKEILPEPEEKARWEVLKKVAEKVMDKTKREWPAVSKNAKVKKP